MEWSASRSDGYVLERPLDHRTMRSRMVWAIPLAALLVAPVAQSQTVVGPGNRTTIVNVTTGTTTVVGGTTINVGGGNTTNVTGGTLTFDVNAAGPLPGGITVMTTGGSAIQTSGGAILVPNGGLAVQTTGGFAFFANGSVNAAPITISQGATIAVNGVGAGLAAYGANATINAADVEFIAGAASKSRGAAAQNGGTINIGGSSSFTFNGTSINALALGASGANSRVVLQNVVPIVMNAQGSVGMYVYGGGQIALAAGETLQFTGNNTGSTGFAVDGTTVATGTIGSGLTLNFSGAPGTYAASTGVLSLNGGNVTLDSLNV